MRWEDTHDGGVYCVTTLNDIINKCCNIKYVNSVKNK